MKGLAWRRVCFGFILSVAIALSGVPMPAAFALQITAKGAVTSRLGREAGLPIPRFASFKSGNARMRIGPSTDYGTSFVYKVKGLPLEIIDSMTTGVRCAIVMA